MPNFLGHLLESQGSRGFQVDDVKASMQGQSRYYDLSREQQFGVFALTSKVDPPVTVQAARARPIAGDRTNIQVARKLQKQKRPIKGRFVP